MATAIHHGAPGSFKSFTLVQRFSIQALKEGRVIVTNIRGFNTIERVKAQFPDIEFPESAQIIFVTGETKHGRHLLAGFFHWVPMGAMILIDEAQRVYPDRRDFKLESLDKPIIPQGFIPEKIEVITEDGSTVGRPEDVFTAYDMQRHFNWDVYMSTPNIAKIQKPIREVAEYAYYHKSLSGKIPFLFKDTWYEFKHDAENNGRTKAVQIGNPIKYKADTRVYKCYQSTVTGKHTVSQADQSIFKDTALQIKLGAVFIAISLCIFFLFKFSAPKDKLQTDIPAVKTAPDNLDKKGVSTALVSNQADTIKNNSNVTFNGSNVENNSLSHALGFKVLSLAFHDLRDIKNTRLSFIVHAENGLKTINFDSLVSFGYQVFTHGLCHISLRKNAEIINLTCSHPEIDRCSVIVRTNTLYSQRECSTYADNKPIEKTSKALMTASNNLINLDK